MSMATLADLSLSELESIILDSEMECLNRYGQNVSIQATHRRIQGTEESAIEFAVSNETGCREYTMALKEPYFNRRAHMDEFVSEILAMLCRALILPALPVEAEAREDRPSFRSLPSPFSEGKH